MVHHARARPAHRENRLRRLIPAGRESITTPGHGPGGGPAGTARYPDVEPTVTCGTAQTLRQPGIQVPSVTV